MRKSSKDDMATRDILLMIRENGGFWELQRKSRSNRNGLAGNLDARVKWSKDASDRIPRDAIGRRVYDFNHMADRLQSLVGAHSQDLDQRVMGPSL